MNKKNNKNMKSMKYIIASVLILSSIVFSACSKEENTLSKAVLTSAANLSFDATGAKGKIITVYADADWESEVPEWITVTPSTGSGTMDVTISVNDNMRDGEIDNPRKETLVFKGATLASRAEVRISQDGDKYRDCKEYTLSEIATLTDEDILSVKQANVMALTTKGFIVSDDDNNNGSNIYVMSEEPVMVGDKISIKGTKNTDSQKLVYIECDEVKVVSHNDSPSIPEETDITDKLDSYKSNNRDIVCLTGILSGNNVTIEGCTNSLQIIDAAESLNLNALNGHIVKVSGYFAGVAEPALRIIASKVEDKGIAEVIYFSEDFEWLKPWATNSKAGQTVENDGDGTAPQVYTATNAEGTTADKALIERGYGLEEIPGHAIYLQDCYLKFGRTDYQAGLTLPSVDNVPTNTNVTLSFDWAPMVGSTRKFDPVQIIVSVKNGDNVVDFDPIGHTFQNTVDNLSWLHAEINLGNITINKDTQITIKSDGWGNNKANTGSSVYRRWFIDNIKLTKTK